MQKNTDWQAVGKICAFSGYRPLKLPFRSEADPNCLELKSRLKEEIYTAIDHGCTDFLCGMALGSDTWAAETVLEARTTLSGLKPVRLHAYLPFPEQAAHWSAANRKRYHHLLSACDSVTLTGSQYLPDSMERRNQAMIDRADRLIAVFDGKSGGTQNTILMAHRKGIEIRILSPILPAGTLQQTEEASEIKKPKELQTKLF